MWYYIQNVCDINIQYVNLKFNVYCSNSRNVLNIIKNC